jgi:hypothetical protein
MPLIPRNLFQRLIHCQHVRRRYVRLDVMHLAEYEPTTGSKYLDQLAHVRAPYRVHLVPRLTCCTSICHAGTNRSVMIS